MEKLGIHYHVALDGIPLWLVLLTSFTMRSRRTCRSEHHDAHQGLVLLAALLQGAMIGAFVSMDPFLFYIFWELMLIPMYVMIGVWGGTNRIKSAIKFFPTRCSARC